MKKNLIYTLTISIVSLLSGCTVFRDTKSTTMSRLQSTEWEAQFETESPYSIFQRYEVDKITTLVEIHLTNSKVKVDTVITSYYLSDKIEPFDSKKVGKYVNGKYLIEKKIVLKIQKLNSSELILKNVEIPKSEGKGLYYKARKK